LAAGLAVELFKWQTISIKNTLCSIPLTLTNSYIILTEQPLQVCQQNDFSALTDTVLAENKLNVLILNPGKRGLKDEVQTEEWQCAGWQGLSHTSRTVMFKLGAYMK
jgi:hypothetical protein